MSKKKILLWIYGINLVMVLLLFTLQFSLLPSERLYEGKTIISARWPQALDSKEVIDTLYAVSDALSADLMIETVDETLARSYYRTERDPAFIRLEGLEPGQIYASAPKAGEEQLRGFFFLFDDPVRIAPLNALRELDADLSVTNVLVRYEQAAALRDALAARGAELPNRGGGAADDDYRGLHIAIAALAFFLLIAVVFYAFSRAKDMVVKKAMGYGDWDVVRAELWELGRSLLWVSVGVLLPVLLLFSLLANLASILFFLQERGWLLLPLFAAVLLVVAVCIRIVSGQCRVSHSKGRSLDRQLYGITVVFKTVVIMAFATLMVGSFRQASKIYHMQRATEQAAERVDGYAFPIFNVRFENPEANPKRFAPLMRALYDRLHDENNLILADFDDLWDEIIHEGTDAAELPYSAKINDNYLDAFDTILDTDGKPIHSDRLEPGKRNMLVPQDFNLERFLSTSSPASSEINVIRYDPQSRFFTFSNHLEGGYVSGQPLMLNVFDPAEMDGESDQLAMLMFQYACQDSFFTYDTASKMGPREQILPLLEELGLQHIILQTPTVKQQFLENLSELKTMMRIQLISLLVLLFAFVVLVIYAAELYYKIHAKDIAAKALAGYSFLDLFSLRMVFKLVLLPVLILMPDAGVVAAVICMAAELGLFTLCMKKNMRHKVAAVMKGE